MLSFLSGLIVAQATPAPAPQEILRPQEMRSLPGHLDETPVFNSNSPELVLKEGILLSTFPKAGKRVPEAHLNYAFSGRFDLFAHHIAKGTPDNLRTLYLGILVQNPGSQPVTIDVLQAASYLSQPDAPFIDLPAYVNTPEGNVYSGPGSRITQDILRGKRQDIFPPTLTLAPGESQLLMNLPIPVKTLNPPLNGRSSLLKLRSTGPVYLASMALFAKDDANGQERPPTLAEWADLLQTGELSTPRDRVPTPIEQTTGQVIYGRVAGVSLGTEWKGLITDPGQTTLTIPQPGNTFSYGLSLLNRGTLGTQQNQSAKMRVRYPDTAYQSHGNYTVRYSLTLPLVNPSDRTQAVAIMVETPLKREDTQQGLRFFDPLPRQVFFRGAVRLRYTDDDGLPQLRDVHLVQRRGQAGEPLILMNLRSQERRLVQFDFLYPPDATPPQVITVQTLNGN
ncbi:MAG: hypothetical protein B0A82_12695 [Alkalinema sp. CACIAM 70d]|nr:MAG: hypothetical protein B0A82_12695 [Alkalinema sp. CACIAM 70d]